MERMAGVKPASPARYGRRVPLNPSCACSPTAKGDLWNLAAVCVPPRRVQHQLTKKPTASHALCTLCVRMRVMRVIIYPQMTSRLHFFAKTFCIPSFPVLSFPRGIYCSAQNPERDYRGGGGYLAALLHLHRPPPHRSPYHCGMETRRPQWSQIPRGRNSPCSLAGFIHRPRPHRSRPRADCSPPG